MTEPIDMIVPMLREIRADIERRFAEARADGERRHAEIVSRLERLEVAQISFKQSMTADTLMSKLLTGEFEERIEALERKVRELETQK